MECIWNGQHLGLPEDVLSDSPVELAALRQRSNTQFLETLAEVALKPAYTATIFTAYEPLFVDFCTRWLDRFQSHEVSALAAVAALARILPCAPHLSLYAEEIACTRKSGHFAILYSDDVTALSEVPELDLLTLLGTIYRLLSFDEETFSCLVPLSPFQVLLRHKSSPVRCLAMRALCIFLRASDSVFQEMMDRWVEDEEPCGFLDTRTINFRFLPLWEEKRLHGLHQQLHSRDHPSFGESSTIRQLIREDLSANTTYMAGVLVPCLESQAIGPRLFMTATTLRNLQIVTQQIRSPRPVLIIGLPGCGKTTLVHYLAHGLNTLSSMVTLHLNEQTDAKGLVGMYTSASEPGSFKWQPGVLTTAVQEGRWVFIEDLDRAPAEVTGLILPLLDRNELLVPQLGGWQRAASGFKLIATIRSSLSARGEQIDVGTAMLGSRHWAKVKLDQLSDSDLSEILQARFPLLTAYGQGIMDMYRGLKNFRAGPSAKSDSTLVIGSQQLFRFCARLQSLLNSEGIKSSTEPISETVQDSMFLEAVDCFSASSRSGLVRTKILEIIAQTMSFSPERAQHCLQARIPALARSSKVFSIGRVSLSKSQLVSKSHSKRRPFATTNQTVRYMESIGSAIRVREPCLLVGETGTGKTTIIQELATELGQKLIVVNLSQQSEASDLLGGYKPINPRSLALPLQDEFNDLFSQTVSSESNIEFRKSLERSLRREEWERIVEKWRGAVRTVQKTLNPLETLKANPKKRRKIDKPEYRRLKVQWEDFAEKVEVFRQCIRPHDKGFAFSFVEGRIVKAVRSGAWVLLDEINLASSDTLDALADLFTNDEAARPSLLLAETGSVKRIDAHPDFRIFGAMNPATDVGKRDLPPSLRSRFTEYYIESPDQDQASLQQIIKAYLGPHCDSHGPVSTNVAKLYIAIKTMENENRLVDGANQKPHFSLRTLTRTLTYAIDIKSMYGLERALIEGFSMSFLTVLNAASSSLVDDCVEKYLLKPLKNARAVMKQTPKPPDDGKMYKRFGHYLMACGSCPIELQDEYIITPFVQANLMNLVRATSTKRYPVLLQGPTSSGKTSMVEYLAKTSGNRFVRINNHEHTDLQEYLGTYVSGPDGLHFQEGVLVRALREGHWIVLDELNLAPTDVLEALNRLLDDNRELLIPETQEVVRPHPNFMLFATQNPPGLYGGRKVLSRAFRNRFLELHFDDIPEDELETILVRRCKIAPSFGSQIVKVYKDLALLRQSNRMFEQRNSFATLRDLFRWALRDADTREDLAVDGFMLLAERVRNPGERDAVRQVIEKVMRVKIGSDNLYSPRALEGLNLSRSTLMSKGIVWTQSARRLFVLVYRAISKQEPVLLVGGTGVGKTSICQAIAHLLGTELHILNAHQNTETGDLIGSQRPLRNRSLLEANLQSSLISVMQASGLPVQYTGLDLHALVQHYQSLSSGILANVPQELLSKVQENINKLKTLFEWSDGSLVRAMKSGAHFLLDEISLADDSVLERLNSVLEPSRKLLLAEKGPDDNEVKASEGFQFLATMNPGGDYGKKELSPALRNRFTEIWVPQLEVDDILQIAETKTLSPLKHFATPMVEFAIWFNHTFRDESSISLREILSWINFVNIDTASDAFFRLLHGAAMVYVDGLGANPSAMRSITEESVLRSRQLCIQQLDTMFQHDMSAIYEESSDVTVTSETLTAGPFVIHRRCQAPGDVDFTMRAGTTKKNASRIFRALQLEKPLLIEGSPGVGKTTLVAAIAKLAGIPLTRINLSDQTDVMDLFGSDVPVDNGEAGQFTWSDAPFLKAMQRGEWVLLDEMNLASQSILESLNACLDHRGEAYVPELDKTFTKHPDFRVFAAQNPHGQGGGRKGLPASFVNRFTVVYAESLQSEDLMTISAQLHPRLPRDDIFRMVESVTSLSYMASNRRSQTMKGGPWEFNLRDVLRWLSMVDTSGNVLAGAASSDLWDLLFLHRLRDSQDVEKARSLLRSVIKTTSHDHTCFQNLTREWYQCGYGILPVNRLTRPRFRGQQWQGARLLESLMICVQQNWPCLLVGASGSGKSTLLHHLASTVGAELTELPLNAESDTMDILGGYEQVDNLQKWRKFRVKMQSQLRLMLIAAIVGRSPTDPLLKLLQECQHLETSGMKTYQAFLEQLKAISADKSLDDLLLECKILQERSARDDRARFEWVDGPLVQALEQGTWLVLDNANLCGPSVLDRLNSLLEPNGVLAVNENRRPDGSVKIVKPHPNFRLFLTVDPRYGEVSRAMRNRCIELHLPAESMNSHEPSLSPDSTCFRLRHFPILDQSQLSPELFWSLAVACLENIAISDITKLEALSKDFEAGLVDLPEQYQKIFRQCVNACSVAMCGRRGELNNISKVYLDLSLKAGLSSDFAMAQPIHPLNNEPLVAALRFDRASYERVLWYGEALEQINRLCLLNIMFGDAARAAEQKYDQRQSLSRLERSTLSTRDLRFSRDNTQPLHSFFSMIDALSAKLSAHFNTEMTEPERLRVRVVVNFLFDFFEIVESSNFEGALFQAYLSIGRSLSSAAYQASRITDFEVLFEEMLGYFRKSLELGTGTRMEALWKLLKPSTAVDSSHLNRILEFEALADEFDNLISRSKAPMSTLSKLRMSLIQGFDYLSHSDSDVIIKDIQSALKDGDSSHAQFDRPRYKHFQAEFGGLRQYLATGSLKFSNNVVVDLFAGRQTKQALCSTSDTESSRRLVDLVKATDIGNLDSELVTVRELLPFGILRKVYSLPDVSIGAFGSVKEELDELGKHLAGNTAMFSEDHLQSLNSRLLELHMDVISSHEQMLDAGSLRHWCQLIRESQQSDSMDAKKLTIGLQPQLQGNTSARNFKQIAEEFLVPSLTYLNNPSRVGTSRIAASAAAWVSFFIGVLFLYIPDQEYDPALTSIVEHARWMKRRNEFNTKLTALRLLEKHTTGCDSNLRCRTVEEDIEKMGQQPELPKVVRPKISRSGHLQVEFNSILRDVLRRCPNPDDVLHFSQAHIDGVGDLRRNITLITQRLSSQYRDYDDIVKPTIALLQGLDVGLALSLVAHHMPEPRSSNHEFSFGMMFDRKMSSSSPWFVDDKPASVSEGLLALAHAVIEVKLDRKLETVSQSSPNDLFEFLHVQWKKQLESDQQKHAATSSLYRYRGAQDDGDAMDEEDFHNLFPDYSTSESNIDVHSTSGAIDVQSLACSVADLQHDLFASEWSLEEQVLNLIQRHAKDLSHSLRIHNYTTSPICAKSVLPIAVLGLEDARTQLSYGTSKSTNYNFYEDANIVEVSKLHHLLERVLERFQELKDRWPEHVTLDDVLQCVRESMAFRHVEPLAKVLTKVEKLHGYVHEWQVVASTEFSAAGLYDELTELLVSWRRIELSTWSRLLQIEDEKCLRDAKAWWFIAYEAIILGAMADDLNSDTVSQHVVQLLTQLVQFLETTSFGQYTARLDIIETFRRHLTWLPLDSAADAIANALHSFVQFYRRFQPAVEESLAKRRAQIEKDLKEVVLFASWKDTNINALRESAKRSHHKLFKVVRKYRTLLAEPVEAILHNPVNASSPPIHLVGLGTGPAAIESDLLQSALKTCRSYISDWNQQSNRHTDPMGTVSIMQRHSELPDGASDGGLYLESFTSNVVDTIRALRKETPSTLTKENTDVVKHLKSRKRKVFADALKDLRRMGFHSNVNADTLCRQRDISTILTRLATTSRVAKAHVSLFASLDYLGSIRSNARSHSDELTSGEVARSVGIFESMLDTAISDDASLIQYSQYLEDFNARLSVARSLWSPQQYSVQLEEVNKSDHLVSVARRLVWLQGILQTSSTVLDKQKNLGGHAHSQLKDLLHHWISRFEEMEAKISALPRMAYGLSTSLHHDALTMAMNTIVDFNSQLRLWESEYPNARYVLHQISPWVTSEGLAVNGGTTPQVNGHHANSLSKIQADASNLVNSMLVGMQTLKTTLNDSVQSTDEVDWLSRSRANLVKALTNFHLSKVTNRLASILDHLRGLNNQDLVAAAAICTTAMPILIQYRDAYDDCLRRFIGFHESLCGMTQVLSRSLADLLKSGFCSPQEKSNEKGASEKLEDGTGLGEGEGAEDISKDVQDDEDLSELAQEATEKDNKDELEDEKDAVDMGADELEGEMGDAEDKSDQGDDDENRSQESGDEMDEETGSVDDLDPSAVDEKTWDGKNDQNEAEKEKEGNKPEGQKEKDMTAQNENSKAVDDEDEIGEEGVEEGDEEVKQEEAEPMDPRAAQEENLDLPEDMNMDDDKKPDQDSEDDALDDMSDIAMEDTNEEDDQGEDREDEATGSANKEDTDDEPTADDLDAENQDASDTVEEPTAEGNDSNDDNEQNVDTGDDHGEAAGQEANETMLDQSKDRVPQDVAKENAADNEGGEASEDVKAAGVEGETGNEKSIPKSTESSAQERQEGAQEQPEKAEQPFKKLGDALETWHRLNQQIQEAAQESVENQTSDNVDAQDPNQEFEHLPDENADADAQALGEATDEQAHILDKEALESEKQQQPQNFPINDEPMDLDEDQEMRDAFNPQSAPEEKDQERNPTTAVDKRQTPALTTEGGRVEAEDEDDMDDLDDIDNDMSSVQLHQDPPEPARSIEEAQRLWSYYESLTRDLALTLTEQLRLILAPTLASKMRGDFRTGKRLNIKRIIPYIASQYKRDKIWMRRSIPSKRSYQIMLALDDSKSMGESGSGKLAFETLALVSKSLSMLEVGQICIVGFGSEVHVAHEFDRPFSSEAGANVFRHFGFKQTKTNVHKLLRQSMDIFREARAKESGNKADLWQLQLIISDGICEDHESIRRLLRQAHEERVMVVFVIVDALTDEPIMEMKQVTFEEKDGQPSMQMKRYLEDFPFGFYLIVGDVKELPHVLATALRQWFAEVVESG